jgi:hypothetical protein
MLQHLILLRQRKMNIVLLMFLCISMSCTTQIKRTQENQKFDKKIIKTKDYTLHKATKQKGTLLLFPCYPCNSAHTLREFPVIEQSLKNGISVVAMNFNERLFLNPSEKEQLAKIITDVILQHNLSIENVFIGGFSSGGNVSLLISDYLVKSDHRIQPKGVFVVDAPIDLVGLYKTAEKNIQMNFSQPSVQEATWIKSFFDAEFGNPKSELSIYEKYSPFTLKTKNINNLMGLKNVKLRLYTEPDLVWWQLHRKNNIEDLNAYYLKELHSLLEKKFHNNTIEFIETKNKGYRTNGDRHPHSWSIVDVESLIQWILNERI